MSEASHVPRGRSSPLPALLAVVLLVLSCVGMPWIYFVRDYAYVQGTAREAQQFALFAANAVAWLGIGLGVAGLGVAGVLVAGAWTRWASPQARAAALQVALKRADHLELPDGLNSLTIQPPRERPPLQVQLQEAPGTQTVLDAPPPTLPPPPAASFAYGTPRMQQLVERGDVILGGEQLLVGYAGQQPRQLRPPEWGLMIVAGQSGKGKSSAAALLIGQAALNGWAIFVCDPAYKRDRSLLRQQLAGLSGAIYRQAIEPAQIAHTVALVTKIARHRIDGEPWRERVLLVVDDFSSLAGRDVLGTDALTDLFLTATQASAAGVHTLLIAHDLRGAWFGGAVARQGRDQATHRLIFNMSPDAARPILPSAAHANQVAVLPIGAALYFDGGEEPALLQLPHLTAEDLAWAAQGRPPTPYQPWQPKALAAPAPAFASPVVAAAAPPPARAVPLTVVLDWPTAQKILDVLAQQPAGLDAEGVATATGESLSTIKVRLAELKAEGKIAADRRSGKRGFTYTIVRHPAVA